MANISLGFNLSASAVGMSQGINAGVVELQKLGYAAKRTAADVAVLRNLEIGRAFISAVQTVASTFTRFTSGASSAVDSTSKLSRALGVSYQELRTLQVASDLSGASSQQLAAAFTRAQLTITKAGQGSKESVAALRTLGLTVQDLAGRSAIEQFTKIAAAVARIPDPAQRAAAAVQIFGRSGAELLPVFQGLPDSLNQARSFLDQFKGGLNDVDAAKVESLNDSFTLASQAIQELAGRVLAQLQPALQRGAEQFVAFVAAINVREVADRAREAIANLAAAFQVLAPVLDFVVTSPLKAFVGYVTFVKSADLAKTVLEIAFSFRAAAASAGGFAAAATAAEAAMVALKGALRGLLLVSIQGAIAVGFSVAAEAALKWAGQSTTGASDVQVAIDKAAEGTKKLTREFQAAAAVGANFGAEVSRALKVPQELSVREFAQGGIDAARSAIVALANDLGGLDQLPEGLRKGFVELQGLVRFVNREHENEVEWLGLIDDRARELQARIKSLADSRRADADAARAQADAARRAAEEARNRVGELANQSLPGSEQSRLQLMKDMAAVAAETRNAEQALAAARAKGDVTAVAAAKERLRLAQLAGVEAKEQDRIRRLDARGLDQNLFKPQRTILDDFKAVRAAFDAKEINGEQAAQALRNLAAEGIQIRQEILAELSRPAQRALQVSDIRTSEGMAQFLATGREDPAIAQRREQLSKLEQIRQAVIATGARVVDI